MWLVDIILDRIGPDQSFGREWTLWSTLTTMFNTSLNKTTVCLTLKLTSNLLIHLGSVFGDQPISQILRISACVYKG